MNDRMREFEAEGNGQNGPLSQTGYITAGAVGYDSLFHVLWRGRLMILLSVVAAGAAVYLYLQQTTPLYDSTARILIEKRGQQTEVPPPVGSTPTNYVQTQAGIISSREILVAALRDPNILTLPTLRSAEHPLEEVIRTLTVSVGKNTDIVSITAESPYPDDAAQIVNAVVRAYQSWHEANRESTTTKLLGELKDQYDDSFKELLSKWDERRQFERGNPEVIEIIRGGIVLKTLEVRGQELAAAQGSAAEQRSYYEGLKRFESDPGKLRQYIIHNHLASGAVPEDEEARVRLREELFAAEARLAQLATRGSLQETSLLQNRVDQIRQRLVELDTEFVQKQISMAKVLSDDADAREKQLADMYKDEFDKVQDLAGKNADYASIISEYDALKDQCDSLNKQIDVLTLDLAKGLEGLNIHVLEWALPATEPSSPQVATFVSLALILGLIAGGGLASVRDWRRQRVNSADEIIAMLGTPILGAVPSMARHGFAARAQRLRLASHSAESEAYRGIRTALFFGAGEKARTILVTSPDHMEGKTTLVSNLGIAMAQAGQKTLILDANLRKPMQHRAFSFKRYEGGLTDVLTGGKSLEEAIRPTPVAGLDVLTGGGAVSNPSELLSSREFTCVLGQLEGMYDRILVDSPPAAVVTDAQILATHCSLTLLVLRVRISSRIATQRARDALFTVKARLGGVVLNDVPRREVRYSHYGANGSYNDNHGSNGGRQTTGYLLPEVDVRPKDTLADPAGE